MQVPTVQRSGDSAPPMPPPSADEARIEAVETPLAGTVLGGMALTAITLGIYRFWYRTNLRKYYWANTRLAGDGFEYTGTGKELFIGFLIALAIIIPLNLVVTLISLMGGAIVGPILATLVGVIVIPAVIQIAIYRARRYRLTRTRFRGLRFHQTGTGTAYMLKSLKWILLVAITLGIMMPQMRVALEKYRVENSWYGSAQGRFTATAGPLMKSWLAFWGTSIAMLASFGAIPAAIAMGASPALAISFAILPIALGIALFVFWQAYRTAEFRHFVSHSALGDVGLRSDLALRPVIWIWIRYYLIIGAMLLGLALVATLLVWKAAGFSFEGLDSLEGSSGREIGLIGTLTMVTFVASALLTELKLRRSLWALRMRSIAVSNIAAIDAIVATAGSDASGVGEAFDTGFDIAG